MTQEESKRIEIYKDGDINFNAVPVTINDRRYGNFDVLLDDLSSRVPLPYGVRNIYTPLGRNRVEDIDDLIDGKQYVATSQRKIKRLEYGSRRNTKKRFIIPRPPSNLKYRPMKDEKLFVKRRFPKLLTVVSNENTDNMTRYVLAPRMENFDMVLQELSNKLRLNGGPVAALMNEEGQKITSCEVLYNSGDTVVAHSRLTMKSDSARSEPDGRRRQSSSKYKKSYSARVKKSDIEKLIQPKQSSREPDRNSSRTSKGKTTSRSTDKSLSSSQNNGGKKTARSNGNATSRSNGKEITSSRGGIRESQTPKKQAKKKKECLWLVTLETSDIDGAYSDNTAYITLYGDNGKTSEYHLGVPPHTGAYFKGSTNEVEIKVEDVGDLYKIRLGHDDDGVSLGWHLKNIVLTNLETNEEYLFECNTWLSRDHADGEIIKEFATAQESAREALKRVTYEVRTYTSDQMKEHGSDSNMFINIIGERGDTGKRQLIDRSQNKTHFQSGQEDIFNVKAISLGPIEKIEIINDNSGENSPWFLEKVKIKETSSFMEYTFPCNKWLKEEENANSEENDEDREEEEELSITLYPKDEGENDIIIEEEEEEEEEEEDEDTNFFDLDDAKKEMYLFSTQSGKTVCFNKEKEKFHGKGCSKACCTWNLYDGGDEFTRLVHLVSCDGHIAIDDENLVLTKGNPGLLNEFNIEVNENNQISFESVVFNGVYIGCDSSGKIAVASANAPERLFTFKSKSGMRDGNLIRFIEPISEKIIGVNSESNELELIENTKKKKELQAATFIVHKSEGMIRTFRSKQNGKYIVLNEDHIFSCNNSKPSKACSFKVHRKGDGLFVQLEINNNPGQFLCVDNDDDDTDDGKLRIASEEENKTNCFHLKIVKAASQKSEKEDPICEYPFSNEKESEKPEEKPDEKPERPRSSVPQHIDDDDDSLLDSSDNENDAEDEVLYRDDTFVSARSDSESEKSGDESGNSDKEEELEKVEKKEVSDVESESSDSDQGEDRKSEDEKEEAAKSDVENVEEASDTEEEKIRKEEEQKKEPEEEPEAEKEEEEEDSDIELSGSDDESESEDLYGHSSKPKPKQEADKEAEDAKKKEEDSDQEEERKSEDEKEEAAKSDVENVEEASDTEEEKIRKEEEQKKEPEEKLEAEKEEEEEDSDIELSGSDDESESEDLYGHSSKPKPKQEADKEAEDAKKKEEDSDQEEERKSEDEKEEAAKSDVENVEEASDTEEEKIRKEEEQKKDGVEDQKEKGEEESDVENLEEESDTEEQKIQKERKKDFARQIGFLSRRQTDGHIMKRRSTKKSKGDSPERPSTAAASLKSPSPPSSGKAKKARNLQKRLVTRRHTEAQFKNNKSMLDEEENLRQPKDDSVDRPRTAPQRFAKHSSEDGEEKTSKRPPSRIQSARKPATPKQLSAAQEESTRPCSSPVRPDRHPSVGRFSPLRSISAFQDDSQQRPPSSGRPISVPVDRAEYNPSNTIGEQEKDENDTNRRTPSPTPPKEGQATESGRVDEEGKEQVKEEVIEDDEEVDADLKEFNWKIQVSTGNDDDASTSSNVTIMLFGSKDKSDYKVLGLPDRKTGLTFQKGKTKVFDIKTRNIGKLKKIRIMHDQSGKEPDWKLRKLTLENKSSKAKETKFVLPCNRWLSEKEGDCSTVREIPVNHKKTPVSLYRVQVETGHMDTETIDPKVFVNLTGADGETTGERLLNTNGTSFKSNTVSVMLLECVTIGEIKSIILRNAEANQKAWNVKRVIIQKANSEEVLQAECNCWLSESTEASREFDLRKVENKNLAEKSQDENLNGGDSQSNEETKLKSENDDSSVKQDNQDEGDSLKKEGYSFERKQTLDDSQTTGGEESEKTKVEYDSQRQDETPKSSGLSLEGDSPVLTQSPDKENPGKDSDGDSQAKQTKENNVPQQETNDKKSDKNDQKSGKNENESAKDDQKETLSDSVTAPKTKKDDTKATTEKDTKESPFKNDDQKESPTESQTKKASPLEGDKSKESVNGNPGSVKDDPSTNNTKELTNQKSSEPETTNQKSAEQETTNQIQAQVLSHEEILQML